MLGSQIGFLCSLGFLASGLCSDSLLVDKYLYFLLLWSCNFASINVMPPLFEAGPHYIYASQVL